MEIKCVMAFKIFTVQRKQFNITHECMVTMTKTNQFIVIQQSNNSNNKTILVPIIEFNLVLSLPYKFTA